MAKNKNEIMSTRDYGKFSLHNLNRAINLLKVDRLAEAMSKNNLLDMYPIVVNKNFQILDGQHRFMAAKQAKVELFYVISNGKYDIDQVAQSNNFQSHWKAEDYINYFAKQGKESYVRLLQLATKYHVGARLIANLSDSSGVNIAIKDGSFNFSDQKEVADILIHAKAIGVEFQFEHWRKRAFIRAIRHCLNQPGYNKLRMQQKLQANKNLLVQCHTADDYVKLFETIYNLGALEEVRLI